MKGIRIETCSQINVDIIDPDYYGIEANRDDITVEFSFTPHYVSKTEIEIFLHIRYLLEEEQEEKSAEDERLSLLHADFIGQYSWKKGRYIKSSSDEHFMSMKSFSTLLSATVHMAGGYLANQTRGNALSRKFLPMISIKELIENSPHVKDGAIKLVVEPELE